MVTKRRQQPLGEFPGHQAFEGFSEPTQTGLAHGFGWRSDQLSAAGDAEFRVRGQFRLALGTDQHELPPTLQAEFGNFRILRLAFRTLHLSLLIPQTLWVSETRRVFTTP
jgi:hypothetical protein